MGSHSAYGRFSQFYERHFRFAQVFMEAAMRGSGCSVSMTAEPRYVPDFRFSFFVGGAATDFGTYGVVGGGFDVGVPLIRSREVEFIAGLRAMYMFAPDDYRDAVLVGARTGLRFQTNPANVGVVGEVFSGGGVSFRPGNEGSIGPSSPAFFGEVGAGLRVSTPMLGAGVRLDAGVEAALGTEFRDEPDALRWARVGASLGIGF
jgi:hypothetical protein